MAADPAEIAPEATAIPQWLPGLIAANAGKPLAELEGDASTILARLRAGENVRTIAKSLNISHVALYTWLLRVAPDDWQHLSAAKSLAKIEDADAALEGVEQALTDKTELSKGESALHGVTISRARESAKLAQWSLERVARRMYGQRDESAQGAQITVIVQRDTGEEALTIIQDK